MTGTPTQAPNTGVSMKVPIAIRNARATDLAAVISLDRVTTKEAKPEYWGGVFSHFVTGGNRDRLFLVAETDAEVIGFIVGEVRAWEFGSPPCGWVFALAVSPNSREMGIGKQMFDEISAVWKRAGIATLRTMVDRDDKSTLSFFRSTGFRTGSFVELEMHLDQPRPPA